jgi:hypothetical protein
MVIFIVGFIIAATGFRNLDPVGINDHTAYLWLGLGIGMMVTRIMVALSKP